MTSRAKTITAWLLLCAFASFLFYIRPQETKYQPATPIEPSFEVGACITLVQQPKSWERPNPLYQIVKKDDEAYAVCEFKAGCKQYLQTFGYLGTIYFKDQSYYYQQGCNEQ